MDSKKVWERALKNELGPTLSWLLDEMANATFRSKSEDVLLLDPPTSDRLTSTALQTKLGLFVLGRTPRGLFGVERAGQGPLDARPLYTAPFKGVERTLAALNLGQFLRGLEGFEALRAQASKPMPSAAKEGTREPRVEAKSSAIKLTKAKAVTLAGEQIHVSLRALGPAVSLLIYDDEITCPAASTLDVSLAINLPSSTSPALVEHVFVKSVADHVRLHLEKVTGYRAHIRFLFDPLDTGAAEHTKHLHALVQKTGSAEAVSFVNEALLREPTRAK